MKKWTYNIVFKSLCVFLATVSLVFMIASAASFVLMVEKGGYEKSFEQIYKEELQIHYDWLPCEIADRYYNHSQNEEVDFFSWIQDLREEYGFDLVLRSEEDDRVLYTDRIGEDYVFTLQETVAVHGSWKPVDKNDDYMVYEAEEYTATLYVKEPAMGNNTETCIWILKNVYQLRSAVFYVFFISLSVFAASTVFLCCAAGRRGDGEEVVENFFDRLYLEFYFVFGFFFFLIQVWWLQIIGPLWLILLFGLVFFCLDAFLAVLFVLTLATRIKSGHFYQHTATFHLLSTGRKMWQNALLVPKVALSLFAVALFDFFLATTLDYTEFLAAVLIEGLVLSGLLIWYCASICRLYQDQKRLSEGNLDHRCDLSRLPPGLRSLGEALNRSAEGMEKAVEEKMKSERFKTELITNVSHDIKTPLTSIVNYVDLIKKEEIGNDRAKEYIAVLDRQSARLKKLTEDLVESSKAASGVLSVSLEPLDAAVLVTQALGEYQSALEEKNLELCTDFPEEPVFIQADGKRLWRVLDNILNNIVKYALSGTRVYCSVLLEQEKVAVVFRNISASRLNLSGEELTERFVRGDASRNTEGSGLGLAIARSLVELQKGSMEIFVDGDLFRVTLLFDRLP